MMNKRDNAKLSRIAKKIENVSQELKDVHISHKTSHYVFDLTKINMDLLQEYICICLSILNKKSCCFAGRDFYYGFLKPAINTWNKVKEQCKDINRLEDLDIDTAMVLVMGQEVAWAYFKSLTPVLLDESKKKHLHKNDRRSVLKKMINTVKGSNEQYRRDA